MAHVVEAEALVSHKSDSSPEVSVCVITCNHERFIRQALESALAQVTTFPFEIVVSDDASEDVTPSLVCSMRHASAVPITIHNQDYRKGVAQNFAAAYQLCRGAYVALLEGDDYWLDQRKLEKQISVLRQNPDCTICGHRAIVQYEPSVPPERRQFEDTYPIQDRQAFEPGEIFFSRYVVMTSTVMFRRAAIPALPDWLLQGRLYEWPLEMLLGDKGNFAYLAETMSVYRVHEKSAWSSLPDTERMTFAIDMFIEASRHFDLQKSALLLNMAKSRAKIWSAQMARLTKHHQHDVLRRIYPQVSERTGCLLREELRIALKDSEANETL